MAGKARDGEVRIWALLGTAVCAIGLAACMTITMQGQRGIMDLGGFVASGGPYAIEHPAPDWAWTQPVAFIGVWVFAFAHIILASKAGGFGLGYATWCAAFTWAGVNFLTYGFAPPGGGGLAWGWLIAGVIFTLVGVLSALLLLSGNWRERFRNSVPDHPGVDAEANRAYRIAYWGIQLASLMAGVVLGYVLFESVAG